MLKAHSMIDYFRLASSRKSSSLLASNKYLSLCLIALAMLANVQCANEVDCLDYSRPDSVTTFISEASTTDTQIYTIEIFAG